ncbi:hypothetical protein [Undibacterium sp.]|uniref:hypothetical protein n=1 Tax=Undibacterium sp. TaxID=1914977 RepID=UPI00374D98F0
MFGRKKSSTVAPGKKKVITDQRNYHVTQPSIDLAAAEKARLEQGVVSSGQVLSYKDGVLVIKKAGAET